ncbi:NAD(P)H-hydrate dehydratase [Crocosphaera sp. UHCC 0190]|uniref:NAD(P)H-hydrate dehydratase n=1 Tax=Crocosphaera sp. UHCC 0190 TaxID=3110246 RepID=UPI002B1F16D6|nr:NAD(P)H-hydrate dehydratase [Crocosphaera sp. UHCC 0190]MEA5509022.1 NAD(P)H-hydrate dehydratase [Crocosphaera sp. UHCC 0190]
MQQRKQLDSIVVTAEQMARIEGRIFAAGMPVAALMEKAAYLMFRRIQQLYPFPQISRVGVLVGPGHNGGDALVIARELHLQGYDVCLYRPFPQLKELTQQHANYADSLGIPYYGDIESLSNCQLIIDGLFGFGLTRSLSGNIALAVDLLNEWSIPVVSVDIPSGLHTDTGEILGTAVKASLSLCLGLWKPAFFQDQALPYIGQAERIDFGIPLRDVWSIISQPPPLQILTQTLALEFLPLPRPLLTHKYQQGHLLLICGSRRYAGGSILTGLGARASGVGMLSIAVPTSIKPLLVSQLPDALIIDCPETATGAIAELPPLATDFDSYNVIACGPGLTRENPQIIEKVLEANCPLILDADGLNILAQLGMVSHLSQRPAPTILTPHLGEFKRLFPQILHPEKDRITAVKTAARESGAIILLKGARTIIAHPQGTTLVIAESTPALARGGSGDVLTGLIGGLLGQILRQEKPLEAMVATAAWWHSQGGILAAKERTELGVDAFTLSHYLHRVLLEN